MIDWYERYLVESYRRQDEIAAADHERLVKAALAQNASLKRHQRWLVALGKLLMEWGCWLQSRYEKVAAPAASGQARAEKQPCTAKSYSIAI